jgi:thiol-disulfide isomerase/thioredoxin
MKPSVPGASRRLAFVVLLAAASGCATSGSGVSAGTPPAAEAHGQLTELSRVDGPIVLCQHKVPQQVCTRCNPQLEANFKRAKDWCGEHGVPESQCLECHPDLTFEPLPKVSAAADVKRLSEAGEDVPDLAVHAVAGKVTVFDFYADWCAACRKVEGHVLGRLARGDTTVALRKLNVVDWESPLAQRYLQQAPSLPLLVVYGRDGKKVAELTGAKLEELDAAIAEAARR